MHRPFRRHLRVVFPQQLSIAGVDSINTAPGPRGEHHAVHHDGGGFEAAVRLEVVMPGQAEVGNIGVINLPERAVALLRGIGSRRQYYGKVIWMTTSKKSRAPAGGVQ